MKHTLLLIGVLGVAAIGASAQSVTKLAASKANDYGIVYSLPQTVITVDLEAECIVKTPGEFYNYTRRYLGADAAKEAISQRSTSWRLTAARLTSGGEIGSDAPQYLMQFKSGSPVFVALASGGLPLAISAEAEEPDAEVSPFSSTPLSESPLDSEAARYAQTEDMVQSLSLAKRAQLAADQIMQLRQSRQDYLTGQADQMPDGKALELILSNINAQEEALTAMFIGTTQTRKSATRVTYLPATESESDIVIARINPLKGFVTADDLSGEPVYLQYSVADRGTMPTNDKGETKSFPKNGVPYCIPGSADFSVEYGRRTVVSATFAIAQLGVVYGLDPGFFSNKKEPGYAIFDPSTGAIKTLGTTQP